MIICQVCNHEIFDGRKFKPYGSGYAHQECKIDLCEPSELEALRAENEELISSAVQWSDLSETLRAENALLSERVKLLEAELNKKDVVIMLGRISNKSLNENLSTLKESKTIYVRRCK